MLNFNRVRKCHKLPCFMLYTSWASGTFWYSCTAQFPAQLSPLTSNNPHKFYFSDFCHQLLLSPRLWRLTGVCLNEGICTAEQVSKQMTPRKRISSFSSFAPFYFTSLPAVFHWFTLLKDGYFAPRVIQRECKLESQNYCIHWKMLKSYSLVEVFPISFYQKYPISHCFECLNTLGSLLPSWNIFLFNYCLTRYFFSCSNFSSYFLIFLLRLWRCLVSCVTVCGSLQSSQLHLEELLGLQKPKAKPWDLRAGCNGPCLVLRHA